jgi:hypothetical protein
MKNNIFGEPMVGVGRQTKNQIVGSRVLFVAKKRSVRHYN